MSKRKAGVKDIIYELDNDDIEISSEDEGKHPKINRLESDNGSQTSNDDVIIQETPIECITLDCSIDTIDIETSSLKAHNGGKSPNVIQIEDDDQPAIKEADSSQKLSTNVIETSILNEDIVVDSPASNTDLGVAGCENRTPLFTVRFKDKKVAKAYKEEIKAFMLKLIKLHDDGALDGSETETDLELDIWPEDLQEPVSVVESPSQEEPEDNFFFVDTDPSVQESDEIPRYRQANTLISNIIAQEPTPPPVLRRGPTCFNCDGAHPLRDCQLPRDNARIADKRKNMVKVGRYHVEDEQKYGHLIPGRISGNLRHALGLKRAEIPLYIYRMRMLGYPPGWLEEARISHSGITMFDSTGSAIRDPEEEEGELSEPGSKDKFDIKKILDFPGFNVPASSRYREEAHLYGLPPLSEQDSKIAMLQMLAPNAMKAYKRKKLTFFPSADKAQADGQAEMELDSGDEVAEFPSVPPLPDDAPLPPPPPPASPPPLPASKPPPPTSKPSPPASQPPPPASQPSPPASQPSPPASQPSPPTSQSSPPPTPQPSPPISQPSPPASQPSPPASQPPPPASQPPTISPQPPKSPSPPPKSLPPSPNQPADAQPTEEGEVDSMNETEDELEIVAVTEVQDIPMPADASHITIEDDTDLDKSELSSDRGSPSLDDLEEKKRLLLNALETDITLPNSPAISLDIDPSGKDPSDSTKVAENENMDTAEPKNGIMDAVEDKNENMDTTEINSETKETLSDDGSKKPLTVDVDINASPLRSIESPSISSEAVKTPTADTKGLVKTTSYGTPVMNIASPYVKLPSDDKFAKDICDVINFENLPNSTGKYKKICNLLKRVKNEVDRIHDS